MTHRELGCRVSVSRIQFAACVVSLLTTEKGRHKRSSNPRAKASTNDVRPLGFHLDTTSVDLNTDSECQEDIYRRE